MERERRLENPEVEIRRDLRANSNFQFRNIRVLWCGGRKSAVSIQNPEMIWLLRMRGHERRHENPVFRDAGREFRNITEYVFNVPVRHHARPQNLCFFTVLK